MNALTTGERAACLKLIAYTQARLDGKVIEWKGTGASEWKPDHSEGTTCIEYFLRGEEFRILAPPKMRAFRDEELPELLGVKIRRGGNKGEVFTPTDTREMDGREMFDFCTFYDGPNAGQTVGKVVDA